MDSRSRLREEEDVEHKKINPVFACFKTFHTRHALEILIFLFAFSNYLTKVSSTNMIMDKVCMVNFHIPQNICKAMKDDVNSSDIKVSVLRVSTNYQLGYTLLKTLPATILSFFIGPWSDHYGRKSPLVIAFLGLAIGSFGSAVCAHFLESRVEYFFIPAALSGIFGGTVTVLALAYSFASDASNPRDRILKFAFVELANGIAQAAGSALGGWMFEYSGYPAVFYLSLVGFCLCILWLIFRIEETRGLENVDPMKEKFAKLFTCDTFRESFHAVMKRRPDNGRKQIFLLIASAVFITIAFGSTGDIDFLYAYNQFHWGNKKYSSINAIYIIVAIVILLFLVPTIIYFKVKDAAMGLIGTSSLLVKYVGLGLSWRTLVYHIANISGVLGGCANMAVRVRISKLATSDDLGKLFLFVATAEAVLPVLSTIFITQIFNACLSVYPGAPYMVLGVLLIFPFSVFAWMKCLPALTFEAPQETPKEPNPEENIKVKNYAT